MCERGVSLLDVLVFDQHRRLEIAAIGDERVVGCELLLDAGLLEDLLDAQHLLHLVADGELVFEEKRRVLAEMDGAVLLVGDDLRAEILPRLGVGLEGHERVAREFFHGGRLDAR